MATQIGQLKYSVGFDVKKQDLNTLKTQLQQLKKLSLSDLMKINQSDRTAATESFRQIREQAEYVEKAIKDAFNVKLNTTNIETFNKSLKDSGTSLEKVYNTFKQGGVVGQNAFRSLVTQVTTANTQLKQTHKFLDNIATTLANTVKWNIASSAVNALSNSVQQAWGYVKSLDTSLNDIRIVTGKSAEQMAKFSEQANAAAQSLGKTTVDYTKAALIYAQQGLSDEDIATRAAITLKTANVTGQSTDAVSEQLTSVWNGYKVSAEEAELYIDRLAAVAATTASDLEQLSTGMSKVAAAAAAMGVGQEQLAAQLSTIISVTRQAPESVGTALRTVYARISDIKAGLDEDGVTLGNYSSKMADLGFKVLDVNDNLRDMGEVIEEIGGRWGTLSREQQISLAQTMAGQRQYSNLIALFDNFDKYTEALHTAQNAAGTLQKQQDTYMESTRAHLNQLKAATEDLYDSLINADSIQPLIDALTTAASLAARFVDSLGGGGTLLLSLGGIAVNVFSDQLTKGVETFVHNLQLGNQQVKLMQQNLQVFDSVLNVQDLDESTKTIIEDFKNIETSLAKRATPEQFKEMNIILGSITASTNEYKTSLAQASDFERQFKNAQDAIGVSLGNTSEFLKLNQQEQQKFERILYQTSEGYKYIINAVNDFSNSIVQQNGAIEVSDQELEIFINNLNEIKDVNFGEGFQVQAQQIDNYINKIKQIQGQNLDPSAYRNFVNEIKQHFNELIKTTGLTVEQINQKTEQFTNAAKKFQQDTKQSRQELEKISSQQAIRSIGRLVGSFTQLSTAVGITSNAFNELRKGNYGSGLTALATSLTSVTTAAISAGKAVQGLGVSMSLATGIGAAVAVISLLVSGLVAWKKAADEARQAQIDLNNTTIENQQKNQQQIDKKQQLLLAVKNLNEEYENGQITRKDLRDEIANLCDQYGIEQSYINNLIGRYGDLAQGIRQVRIEQAKRKQQSLQIQFEATRENTEQSNAGRKLSVGYIPVDLTDNVFANLLSDFGAKIESQYDTWSDQLWSSIVLPENIEDKIDIYNTLSTQLQKYKDDPLYNDLKKWYDDFSASAEKYNDIKEKLDSYLDYDVLSNQYADFQKINTFEDYQKQRQQLIKDIQQERQGQQQQIAQAVDRYLKQTYKGLYNQYNEALQYVAELENRFNSEIDQDVLDAIKELDAAHLDLLQRKDITNWENLRDIVKEVSQTDLSNISGDSISSRAVAADRYTFFKSLEDQVKAGKSISSKQIERFADYGAAQLEQFFTMMANGQYQMTEDAKKFNQVIKNFELDGFFDVIDTLQNKAKQLEKFNEYLNKFDNTITGRNDFNYDELNQVAMSSKMKRGVSSVSGERRAEAPAATTRSWVETTFDHDLIERQLQYLEVFKQIDQKTKENIDHWKELNEAHYADKQMVYDIADAVRRVKDQSETFNQDVDYVNQKLKQTQHQIYKILFPTDEDVNETALNQLSKTLQQLSTKSENLDDDLQNNLYMAEQVAEAILRFDNAIQDVVDHYDDWLLALNQENISLQDQAAILPELRDAYADMLDIDGSLLSDEFLLSTQNLEWMKAIIDGDTQAYENLAEAARVAAIQMLKIDPSVDMSHFEEDIAYLTNYLNNRQNFPTLEIGAELNDQKFLEELSRMINTMGISAAQASDILRENLGIDTQIIQVKDTAKQTQEYPVTNAVLQPVDANGYVDVPMSTGGGIVTRRLPLKQRVFSTRYQPDTESITTTKQGTSFALKVTSANKSAGGHFKYTNATRGAGSAGVARRTAAAEKAAKAAKAAEPKPDTSTKEEKKPMKDDRDIYHDINIELEQINRQLSRAQKVQERLFGKQLIDNLNKQSQILEQHKAKLKEKQALQKLDLAQKREELSLLGATFNEYGHISNYLDILALKQGTINGLIAQYNTVVASYNATTVKETKDAIKDQLTEIERQIKEAESDYKELQSQIKNYDSLQKAIQDITDQVEEQTQKQIEINISKFKMAVEIRLQMGQTERDWNEFRRKVLEGTNVLKDTGFDTLFKDATQNYRDIYSYFDIHGNNRGQIASLTDQVNDILDEIEKIQNKEESIYGDNMAQAIEDLNNYASKLQDSMINVRELINQIDQAYLDTYDDIADQMDKQIDDYEFLNDLIEHDIDLLQLLYGDRQYEAMSSYYTAQYDNQLNQIEFLREAVALVKERWQLQEAAGNTNAAQKLKEQYKDLVSDLNSLVEASVKTLQDKYTNAINQIFDALDKRVTGGLGTDYLQMEWELINKNADEYLDTINSAFALQELEAKFQKAIGDTQNVKNQRILTDLMNQQLDQLRSKEKLTQYDVDRAEKLLGIEQARMALEDQRSAKTSLRLKRDSQGNYSYVYAANEEDVSAAEDNLAKLQNDLYNFDKDAYRRNLDDMLSAWRDFQSKYKEIVLDTSLSQEERIERLALLRDQYGEYINNKVAENEVIRTNLMESAFIDYAALYNGDYEAYRSMIDNQRDALMNDLVPQWNSGIQQMVESFVGAGGFIPACEQGFNELDEATQQYENQLKSLQQAADVDFSLIREGALDPTAESFKELIKQNDALIQQMQNELNDIDNLKAALDGLLKAYQSVWKAADDASRRAYEALQDLRDVAAKQAEAADKSLPTPIEPATPSLPITPQTVTPTYTPPATTGSGTGTVGATTTAAPVQDPWKGFTTTVKGIVGNIWYGGSWDRIKDSGNLRASIGKIFGNFDESGQSKDDYKAAKDIYLHVTDLIDKLQAVGWSNYQPPSGLNYLNDYDYYEMMKKLRGGAGTSSKPGSAIMPFDTGGYTGAWGPEGRLAMLHQKELVLNAQDTKNMLDSVEVLRGIVTNLGGSISARLSGLNGGYTGSNPSQTSSQVDQNVSIQANFPNVNSKREIEEAFSELVNLAAQRALRR